MPKARLGVALVLDGESRSQVDALRRACGDPALDRIPAHLTLVPPVNVPLDRIDQAAGVLRRAAYAHRPFTLDLGPVDTFLPDNPVLYLAVDGALDRLRSLRDAVFTDPLARPLTWSFVPHVTICDNAPPEMLSAALVALRNFRTRVAVDRVHLLREGEDRTWRPIAAFALGGGRVVGRGGLEVELAVSPTPDPETQRFFDAAWTDHLGGDAAGAADAPFCVTARREHRVAGVASGFVSAPDRQATLDRLVVDPAIRREGIGSQLLSEVEHLAAAAGCTRVVLVVRSASGAADFYRARGWVECYSLPAWRGRLDFLRMQRLLFADGGS